MKNLLLLFWWGSMVLVPALGWGQVTQAWVMFYNGALCDIPYQDNELADMTRDAQGNLYTTGAGMLFNPNLDYLTAKFDSAGNFIWAASYNGGYDEPCKIVVDDLGNVYVTGKSNGDYATVKYNSAGVQQWVARYDGPASSVDWPNDLAVDAQGNVYVTGTSSNNLGSNKDYLTLKYNTVGVQQWCARYDGPGNAHDIARCLALDDAGNVFVSGGAWEGGSDPDMTTLKYDANGVQQWKAVYNGPANGFDDGFYMMLDSADNILIGALSEGVNSGEDYLIAKYQSNGRLLWTCRYNGTGNEHDEIYALAVDNQGNAYVTGRSHGIGTQDYDCCTMKCSSSGSLLWVNRFNGTGNGDDEGYAIVPDNLGNCYITGFTDVGAYHSVSMTTKYASNGDSVWSVLYDGMKYGYGIISDLSVSAAGSVYVAGSSESNPSTGSDYIIIKYNQDEFERPGVPPISDKNLEKSLNVLCDPNPFNPTTDIKYQMPDARQVSLRVYDTAGRLVATLVDGWREAGEHAVTFDGSMLASGMYFVQMQAGEYSGVKKIMLLK
jgi:hypothetical protein